MPAKRVWPGSRCRLSRRQGSAPWSRQALVWGDTNRNVPDEDAKARAGDQQPGLNWGRAGGEGRCWLLE
ncbi:hypothetical protein WJX72_009573 [[Myrmecia] bisecta]|uniref:Uncharacterized protein n=1 Tax=[Myrmecia] bisecta TaxID=41462 RepID=A0AAW1QSA0_9CHLO